MIDLWHRLRRWWDSRSCQACCVYLVLNWRWHIRTAQHQAIHGPTRGVIHRVGRIRMARKGHSFLDPSMLNPVVKGKIVPPVNRPTDGSASVTAITDWWVSHSEYGFWMPVDGDPRDIQIGGWTLDDLHRTFGAKVSA